MENKKYTARKVQPTGKGDSAWILEFRHPLIKDATGKSGKKIRKGLGTKDDSKADDLVKQMNILLGETSYWEPSARHLAEQKLDPAIVDIFYEGINYLLKDYESIRSSVIPIKTKEEGYSSALLLGATGAGKTTLLRQLMGTHPLTERFPATSTARTTVFDTEIILSDGLYGGVVTFYTENEGRQMIKDILHKSMAEYFLRNDETHLLRVFLEDKDQRFKLGYILGKVRSASAVEIDEEEEDIDEDIEKFAEETLSLSEEEQKTFEEKIRYFLQQIIKTTEQIVHQTTKEYGGNTTLSDEQKKFLDEIIITNIEDYDGDDLYSVVDEIISEVKDRFKLLNEKDLVREKFGWPIYWHLQTPDRENFLQSIRFFSSNFSLLFGKLLTPLVSGMRVEGPFKPDYLKEIPKLVIFDGEGLGHISDTNTNLPYKTIKKFEVSDAIVLVDSSKSPMLATSYAVLKSIAVTGHADKLFICFTHFDTVKGDDVPKRSDKINKVFGSVDHLLDRLKSEMEFDVTKFFVDNLHKASYYLANINERLIEGEKKYRATIGELVRLTNGLEAAILQKDIKCAPEYEISTLMFRIRKAAVDFHGRWNGYLYGSATINKQHFSRIKALTLRLGYRGEPEYKELMPISDFATYLKGQIANFLSSPTDWHPRNCTDEEKQDSVWSIQQKISKKVNDYAENALWTKRLNQWQKSFDFRDKGSAELRAKEIKNIYDNVVPVLSDEMTALSKQFLLDIMKIIVETVRENGGSVTSMFQEMTP